MAKACSSTKRGDRGPKWKGTCSTYNSRFLIWSWIFSLSLFSSYPFWTRNASTNPAASLSDIPLWEAMSLIESKMGRLRLNILLSFSFFLNSGLWLISLTGNRPFLPTMYSSHSSFTSLTVRSIERTKS